MSTVKTWRHSLKGTITGSVIDETSDGVWVTIELHGDHQLRYGSEMWRGRVDWDGERITVRRSFLTEVTT